MWISLTCLRVASARIGFTYFGIYALLLKLYLLRLGYGTAFISLVNATGPLALVIGSLYAGALTLGFGLLPLVGFMPPAWRAGWLLAAYMLVWLGSTFFVVNGGPS